MFSGIAALIGICGMLGRILTGWLFDRISGVIVAAMVFSLPIIGCILLLLLNGSVIIAIIAACLIGLCLGAETDVAAYLTAQYFGMKHYGALFGTLVGALGIAIGGGPFLAALVYDTFGCYTPFFTIGIVPCVVALVLTPTLGVYPTFDSEAQN